MATAKKGGDVRPISSARSAEPDSKMEIARSLGKQLSEGTDELNAKLAKVEKRLASLGLGVSAWVDMTNKEDGHRVAHLGFRKDGSEWKLFVCVASSPDNEQETPLLQASKRMRIRGAEVVPDLLEAMITEARKQLEDLRRASRSLDEVLDSTDDASNSPDPFGTLDVDEDPNDIPF